MNHENAGDGPGGNAGDGHEAHEDVGSVAEEAAKLFGALSDWAKDHGSDLGHGLAGAAEHAARAAHDVDEHLATGSAECTWCPVCRTIHAVRQTSPEVRAHLTVAAASLMQAAAGLLATVVPDEERAAAARGEHVEHIDLDDEWPEDKK
ncbi:hypothetical protein ACFP3Q_04500 [Nocardioides sp. GCM10027113]|uniref:hypothetical protein n=1 Tax=unclassified Nocardioides TaxID=2615069 RepID=UPI003622D5CA